jgi:Cyclic phosphodiesterase-like protein
MRRGHALWLLPEAATFARLAGVVEQLARAHGGPLFEPHVTLLSGIALEGEELLGRARALALDLGPAAVVLAGASHRAKYYQALFLEVEGGDLHRARVRAAAAMGIAPPPDYRPHVSLLYGDFPPSTKEAILDRIGRQWDLSCTLDRLAVVSPQGPPQSWVRAATMGLGGR